MALLFKVLTCVAALASMTRCEEEPTEDHHVLSAAEIQAAHKVMDRDGDGRISFDEVMSHVDDVLNVVDPRDLDEEFAATDTDNDGRINPDEYGMSIGEDELEPEDFRQADRDADGFLDQREFAALQKPGSDGLVVSSDAQGSISAMDKDQDGLLDIEEFFEGESTDQATEEEHAEFASLDLDGSGKLDHAEMMHWASGRHHTKMAMAELFRIADENKDSHITLAELDAARHEIVGSEAHHHLLDWAYEHKREEL